MAAKQPFRSVALHRQVALGRFWKKTRCAG